MLSTDPSQPSPNWSPTTKTIVGLTLAGILVGLLIYIRAFIGPLLLSFILTYLLHPVATWIRKVTHLSWRLIVFILYLLLFFLLVGILTLSGLAIVNQASTLVAIVQNFMTSNLARFANHISEKSFAVGPFAVYLSRLDLNSLSRQLVQTLEPSLGSLGDSITAVATGAMTLFGWMLFILVVSYFLLSEAGQFPNFIDYIHIPGYDSDIHRIGTELGYLWNAFLRGQLLIVFLSMGAYAILMSGMGVRNGVIILAIMAGFHRLVPFVGAWITWTVTFIITILQKGNYFGLSSLAYALLVVITALLVDQIFENIITPLVYRQALRIHPALLLVGALVAARLLGLIGLLLVAPMIATLKLLGRYISNKMLDLDPWEELDARRQAELESKPGRGLPARLVELWGKLRGKLTWLQK